MKCRTIKPLFALDGCRWRANAGLAASPVDPRARRLPAVLCGVLAVCGLVTVVTPAGAQPYPAKLVRMITGSVAGGGSDITARQIAPRLSELWGQQVLVDNRPGVAGMLANELTAKAAPDGYTLLLQPGSFVTLSSILNARGGPWEPLRHLAPVIQVTSYTFVAALHPSVPARNVKELIAVAKAKPKSITFVSSGVGSNFHLMGELFKLRAGVDLWHVPYKGSPPAIVDLLAGRAELMFIHVPPVLPYIRNGRLRALAVTGASTNPLLPGVPRVMDTLPGFDVTGSEGLLAPAGLPRDIAQRIHQTVTQVLLSNELKTAWADRSMEFVPNTPEQYGAKIREEFDKNAQVIKQAGIRADM